MDISLEYDDNALIFSDLKFHLEDKKNGIPVNTSMRLSVRSLGFTGSAPWDGDIVALEAFLNDLRAVYAFTRNTATLTDYGQHSRITITMSKAGALYIGGTLHDIDTFQTLTFNFGADQTILLSFITSLAAFFNEHPYY